MGELLAGAAMAFWLGILTSVSPCPLATNIAAISYIGRQVEIPSRVLFAGLLYAVGRVLAYVGITVVLTFTVLSMGEVSSFLTRYIHHVLGPILILVGMVLTGLLSITMAGSAMSDGFKKRIDSLGIWGALPLGVIFALSFCPTSAALFFGNLMSAVTARSSWIVPAVYGIGTALPVLLFAGLLAVSANSVGRWFNVLTQVEWWARMITGTAFILIGIYFSLKYIFEVGLP